MRTGQRSSPRLHIVRKVIIWLACLAGVAVLADFSAAAYAEYRVSRALRVGADLTADPAVTFHGFPFVAQVAAGRYRDIEISAEEVRPDTQRDVRVEATLRDVKMPLGHLIDGSVRTVHAGEVQVRTWIDSVELGKMLGIRDLQLSTLPADKSDGTGGSGGSGMTTSGAIVLMGTLPPPGDQTVGLRSALPRGVSRPGLVGGDGPFAGMKQQTVSVEAQLILDGSNLRVVATDLYSGSESGVPDRPVPDQYVRPALAQFTKVIEIQQLPFHLVPTKITGQGGLIVVEAKEQNVDVSLDQLQNMNMSKPGN
jgi:hypothetical protein